MQKSKIQAVCEGIIEAGWLAALIVAPLFFNVYSSRVFEPDKISLVRSISLVMLLAYLVKVADGGRLWLPRPDNSPAAPPPPEQKGFSWRGLWRMPLALPVLFLVVAYAISTLLSVAPFVSWWGSYQRLQGTYTFTSYLIIAVLTAGHLRQPEQLRRLQHTVILTSLPIAIYGVIQHYRQDPLPWGGDVVSRVSANAGNPIFLAAHLIMAFFLTLERVFSSFAYLLTADAPAESGAGAKQADAPPGELPPGHDLASALAGGSYLFVLIVQILAIIWTQSRGPWLGLAGGSYIFVLLLLTGMRPRNYRVWTAGWVGLGAAGAILLVLLNVTPLGNPIRDVPYLGRLTTMLESSGGTGRVRVLIWQGVSEMISPHPPLTFPDGEQDSVNPIRPLVGYGPEAMWVAFNNFYPPELAQIEARNASPDRSHNETWDSLAITGFFGFLANSLLFISIFFWALRWLGLIRSRRDVFLFAGLLLGGGVLLSSLAFLREGGAGFLGVYWPTGLIVGLIVYVTLAVFLQPESAAQAQDQRRQLLIVASLAAIIAHYVEIHFGIAIAATRTYFWVISALLLVLGMRWLEPEPFAVANVQSAAASNRSARSASRRSRRRTAPAPEASGQGFLPGTVMPDLLVLMTLAFLYTTNFLGLSNPFAILFRSLTVRMQGQEQVTSPGILFLVLFTWLIATAVGTAVAALRSTEAVTPGWWARTFGWYGLVLLAGWLIYGLIQAGRLAPGAAGTDLAEQLDHIAGHFSLYTWLVVVWCLAAGIALTWPYLRESRRAFMSRGLVSAGSGLVLAVVTFLLVSNVNVALVRADVFYKQGQQFDSSGDWIGSAELYRRALTVRPTEDHYMLFLGRSLLERAKRAPAESALQLPGELSLQAVLNLSAQEIAQMGQEDLLRAAEVVLLRAQDVNPLNTDHTANLARLYRSWAELEGTPETRSAKLQTSLDYYETAVTLSPNAAHLWNEMGATLALIGRTEEAEEVYLRSLSLDDRFENTYLLLAELYEQTANDEKLQAILEQGLEELPRSTQMRSYLGVAQARSGNLEAALETNLELVERNPNDLNAVRNLAILYRDMDQIPEAILWAERAISLIEEGGGSPETSLPIYRLLVELYSRQENTAQVIATYERMQTVQPEDTAILNALASLYIQNGRLAESAELLQRLIQLEPGDFRYPLQLAQVQSQLGNSALARQFGENALAIAPESEKSTIQAFLASLE